MDVLDAESGHISYINSNMGLSSINAENLGAVTLTTLGNILATTRNGLFSYSVPPGSTQQPATVLESVQLFLTEVDTTASNSFAYDENNFSFHYTGLYYSDPSQVYYQYKLEGLDSNWIITKDHSKTFSKLEPGKYTFRIQSSLNKNFKNADEAQYFFIIKTPYYKTAWFIIGSILLIGGLLFWYIKKREIELKKIQRLQQEKIQFQFEVLRNQVNPHFLFNSFNTLISYIEENPKMAVEYAEQLSDFFRNIVNYRDKEIIPLLEELGLLQTYFFLQQKRYGTQLQLQLHITDEQKYQFEIPPLTLQLLIENAIKHNIVSKDNPLTILIQMEDNGNLTVSNEKKVRNNQSTGTGMGLQNIANRFKILTGKAIIIENEAKQFIIILPLINKKQDENTNNRR